MKSVFLFALVAVAAAGPVQSLPSVVMSTPVVVPETYPTTGYYGFFGEEYGSQGKIFEVAQYIAYQFHLIQELGYTPSQVATYFLEYGFPQYVVDYLVHIYEIGLTEPYFRSPYLIFEYYIKHEISPEVQEYILREIVQALQVFQKYYSQYGEKAYEYEYPGVPKLFSKYVVTLGRYYMGSGFVYSKAHMIYEQLHLVETYVMNVMRFFESSKVPVEVYQYVYRLLKEILVYIEGAQSAFKTYEVYQQKYLPYYFAQYYSYQITQAFHYFSDIYHYIQRYQGTLPEYFIEQIRLAYFALYKLYEIIYSFGYGYGSYVPYSSSYGYPYMPYTSTYGYSSYSPYYSYGNRYWPYSSSYGYGMYGSYSGSYGLGSSYPYYPYSSSSEYYGPYSSYYAKYGSYSPYKYGSYPYSYLTSKEYSGYYPYSYYPYSSYGYPYSYGSGSYMGYSGYPYYGYSGGIAAAAA